MIRVFLAAFLFLVVSTQAAEKPTLAIINGMSSPEAADLLLSKLSAGGEFAFVERAKLAEVVKEQRLTSMSRASNVRTGQLLGAEALLFVEADRELLHVRLVETSRGERLFDEVFPLALDLTQVADAVRSRLARALGRAADARGQSPLRGAGAGRVRFAPRRRFANRWRRWARSSASAWPGRSASSSWSGRTSPRSPGSRRSRGRRAADLLPADAIVRARLADGDADKLSLEFQIQRPNGAAPAVFSTTVVRHQLSDAADAISTWIGRELGVRDQATAAGSTKAEASRQHRNGAALLQAQAFESGLRYLETACLLDPAQDDYAQTYLGGVATCLQRGGLLDRGPAAERTPAREAADYLFYIDRLRSAMAVASGRPAGQSAPLFNGEHVFQFLGRELGRQLPLDEDGRAQVAACREEFRAFLERFAEAGGRAQVRAGEFSGWELLGRYCPYCFADPREALAYIRKLAEAGHFSWSLLEFQHPFAFARHWDQAQAIPLWSAFLDEVQRKPAVEAQFGALVGRCWMRDSFGLYISRPTRKSRPSARSGPSRRSN